VHGVPGFEGDGEVVTVDALGEEVAIAVAAETYGLDVLRAIRFETERDDTFRLETIDDDFVLKIAHPADSLTALDFETRAMAWAASADASLPLPRVLPSKDGEFAPALANHEGRRVRLLTWLPGTPLEDATPTDGELRQLGATLGRLTRALEGFGHPASVRPFAWDLTQFARLSTVAQEFPDDLIDTVFERFDRIVRPRLDELPRQVIHNDFNPGNVIVEPGATPYVTGIIDFGDTVLTARICDLAVGISYQLNPLGLDWQSVQPFIEAYERVVALEPLERELLPELVAVRFAQRVLIYRWMQRGTDVEFGTRGNLVALERLLTRGDT
jgi:hydroxylysine kinase